LIPSLVGQLQRLLGMLFDERGVRFREGQPVHIRQMTETFPLFLRVAGSVGQLAHALKIGNSSSIVR
jgi:hypothetical protein